MRDADDSVTLDGETIELGGSEIAVRVSFSDLWRAYTRLRSSLGAEEYGTPEETMAGFWDWTKKISRVVKEVVKSPIVKMVAGAIPVVGGTIRTVLDAADQTVRAIDSVTKKMPPKTRRIVADAAAGKPAAQAVIRRLPPTSQKKIAKLVTLRRAMRKTIQDATELRKVASAAGLTPAMVSALRFPRAPWRRGK